MNEFLNVMHPFERISNRRARWRHGRFSKCGPGMLTLWRDIQNSQWRQIRRKLIGAVYRGPA